MYLGKAGFAKIIGKTLQIVSCNMNLIVERSALDERLDDCLSLFFLFFLFFFFFFFFFLIYFYFAYGPYYLTILWHC